jgi:DNA-binding transcriptional regulator YdaS (Cro superfamily)
LYNFQTEIMSKNNEVGIAEAVRLAGTQQALSAKLGVSQQAVSIWLRRGWVPLRRALEIEAEFGVQRARLINPRIADLVDLPEVRT